MDAFMALEKKLKAKHGSEKDVAAADAQPKDKVLRRRTHSSEYILMHIINAHCLIASLLNRMLPVLLEWPHSWPWNDGLKPRNRGRGRNHQRCAA